LRIAPKIFLLVYPRGARDAGPWREKTRFASSVRQALQPGIGRLESRRFAELLPKVQGGGESSRELIKRNFIVTWHRIEQQGPVPVKKFIRSWASFSDGNRIIRNRVAFDA